MSALLSKKQIQDYRRRVWRLERAARLRTLKQSAEFLDEVGLCLLFACKDIPLPKIYDSAADEADWWAWKDLLQAKKLAYNGRVVRRKATLMSMELLAASYAVYLTGGGYAMYEEEYYWGRLGQLANKAAEYLYRNGPTPVNMLRAAMVPPGKENTRRFHSALLELQSKFKIVSVGLEDRSWGVRILDLFANWIPPDIERRAENMTREDAINRLLGTLVNTAGAVPEPMVSRIFGWSAVEALSSAESLVSNGLVCRSSVRGDQHVWLVSPKI